MSANTLNTGKPKLPVKMKAGYAIGQMTDSLGYNVFYFFFLFFLTNYAGVPAGIAGTISLIAIMWDAVTDPIVGNISDNLKSKRGRRRPMMLASLIPYSICTFLLFNNVNIDSINAKFIYFAVIAVLFWSSYKVYVIPYFALGAELTEDFNERTSLRSWASVFMQGAVTIASAGPPLIRAMSPDPDTGWRLVGITLAVAIAITTIVCYICTKGGELVEKGTYEVEAKEKDRGAIKDFFVNIGAILKLKPTKFLAISVLLWAMVTSLNSSSLAYVMTSIMGLGEGTQSIMFAILTGWGIAWLPVINFSANKFDKKRIYFLFMLVSGIGLLIFRFVPFTSIAILIVFMAIFAFGNSTFWTLYYSMMYDLSELDEFVNDKRREGTLAALMSFCQKFGAAIAMWLTGMILDMGGYNGEAMVQPDSAIDAIMNTVAGVPGVMGILAALFAFFYPVTKGRYSALAAALKLKKEGKEYTTDGFEKLL